MTTIRELNIIHAPIGVCFDLSLNIDAEAEAGTEFRLSAIAGVTTGRIHLGETVTWRLRQFGIWVTHTTQITAAVEPTYFQDAMLQGVFATFVHDHFFRVLPSGFTAMRDELRLSMPWWLGGPLSERLLITRRVRTMLHKRNQTIKALAEGRRSSNE